MRIVLQTIAALLTFFRRRIRADKRQTCRNLETRLGNDFNRQRRAERSSVRSEPCGPVDVHIGC